MTIKVHEVFKSFQGEGVNIGRPCVFIRLSGCNLNCPFCDSKYASRGVNRSIGSVVSQLSKLTTSIPYVVWTGGEPLLQWNAIWQIIQRLPSFISHAVETNITRSNQFSFARIDPATPFILGRHLHFTMSPKLGLYNYTSFNSSIQSVQSLCTTYSDVTAEFKFVVKNNDFTPHHFTRIRDFLRTWDVISDTPVVIQPESPSKPTSRQLAVNLDEVFHKLLSTHTLRKYCNQQYIELRVLPQLHVMVYGNQKGV